MFWSNSIIYVINQSDLSAVRFAANLHLYHEQPLSEAYAAAVKQFRALRFRHHVATSVAVEEAEVYGAEFDLLEIEKQYQKEEENLSSWDSQDQLDENTLRARKRWRSIIESPKGDNDWTKGQEYVRLWKERIRSSTVLGSTSQFPQADSILQDSEAASALELQLEPSGSVDLTGASPSVALAGKKS